MADGGPQPTGLLTHRDNHHILQGPCPTPDQARRLVFELEYPDPLRRSSPLLTEWTVLTRAFRDKLQWAVVVGNEESCGEAVRVLLKELAARGVQSIVVDDIEAGGHGNEPTD